MTHTRIPLPRLSLGSWQENAACRGHDDPSLFLYPTNGRRMAAAKAVCSTCSVQEQCLIAGQDAPGVWGQLAEGERKVPDMRARLRTRQHRYTPDKIELWKKTYDLRAKGLNYKDIGLQLGVSDDVVGRRLKSYATYLDATSEAQ